MAKADETENGGTGENVPAMTTQERFIRIGVSELSDETDRNENPTLRRCATSMFRCTTS